MHLLLFYWEWLERPCGSFEEVNISHTTLGTISTELDFNPGLTTSCPVHQLAHLDNAGCGFRCPQGPT